MKSKARTLYEKYPDLFMEMFAHSFKEDPMRITERAVGEIRP